MAPVSVFLYKARYVTPVSTPNCVWRRGEGVGQGGGRARSEERGARDGVYAWVATDGPLFWQGSHAGEALPPHTPRPNALASTSPHLGRDRASVPIITIDDARGGFRRQSRRQWVGPPHSCAQGQHQRGRGHGHGVSAGLARYHLVHVGSNAVRGLQPVGVACWCRGERRIGRLEQEPGRARRVACWRPAS